MTQFESIKALFEVTESEKPRFDFLNVAYYAGALLVIGSMGWFMTNGWEQFGGYGLASIAFFYAIIFYLVGYYIWFKKNLSKIIGGLFFTMAVCMTPLAIYGLQRGSGFWLQEDPGMYREVYIWIRGSWILMALGTCMVGSITMYLIPFTFLAAPVAVALWFMSMDLAPLLLKSELYSWNDRASISMIFGMGILALSYLLDRRTKEDYSFWMYIFGGLAFWGGLSSMDSDSEFSKFIYFSINIALIVLSVWLERRIFIILGTLGVFGYLGHLSGHVFKESLLFPFILSLIGLGMMYLTYLYQRNTMKFERFVLLLLPHSLNRFQPKNRTLKSE